MRPQKVTDNQGTRDRILSNALQHFCNFGYNGTSVREITASSEVTKPTLYYYFKNKQELFSHLAETCFQTIIKNIDDSVKEQKKLKSGIMALFSAMDQVTAKNPSALKFVNMLILTPQRGTPDVGAAKFLHRLETYVSEIFKKGVAQGEVLPQKVDVSRVLIAALLGLHTRSLLTGVKIENEDRSKMEFVIDSIIFCSANSDCHP